MLETYWEIGGFGGPADAAGAGAGIEAVNGVAGAPSVDVPAVGSGAPLETVVVEACGAGVTGGTGSARSAVVSPLPLGFDASILVASDLPSTGELAPSGLLSCFAMSLWGLSSLAASPFAGSSLAESVLAASVFAESDFAESDLAESDLAESDLAASELAESGLAESLLTALGLGSSSLPGLPLLLSLSLSLSFAPDLRPSGPRSLAA